MRISWKYFWLSAAVAAGCVSGAYAQSAGEAAAPAPAAVQPAAPQLPYGVDEVLKLARAQISEDVILNYVQNSSTVYNLKPNDILYLKNEGVSDQVIKAMMEKRKNLQAAQAAQAVEPPPAPAPSAPVQAPANSAQAPVYAEQQPAPVYTQPPPPPVVESAPSTVYVIPYPAARSAYYGYYAPYSYYYGPSISLGFGFGFGGHGGYWGHRGYYGHRYGYHRGRW